MATNDPEVLETIRQILDVHIPTSTPVDLPKSDPLAQALGLRPSESSLDEETRDLQQSLDDLFNPQA